MRSRHDVHGLARRLDDDFGDVLPEAIEGAASIYDDAVFGTSPN